MSPFHKQIENALRGPVAAILTKWGTSISELKGELTFNRMCFIVLLEAVIRDRPEGKEWLNKQEEWLCDATVVKKSWLQVILESPDYIEDAFNSAGFLSQNWTPVTPQ